MERIYSTSEAAALIGVHPNTVRLYEQLHFISAPGRKANGYRIFTELHIQQLTMVRLAFQVEVLQNGLRKKAVEIVKTIGQCDFSTALEMVQIYLDQIEQERVHAEEAIQITKDLIDGKGSPTLPSVSLTRKETAEYLGITIDTLRNWELNGLLSVKRMKNGFRVYTAADIGRLKVIRSLRCANYSLAAILRMLQALSADPDTDIRRAINTPAEGDDIFTACDSLLISLSHAESNFKQIYGLIENVIKKLNTNPPL
ncbi:MerR family transcriptional regulator [Clostridium sp. AM58-1XD]|uniref:MerR family transcriptional regulator n=1 Tax=Clostridium sp. AM58-1XD TaxID=2292307 RepID=UPI000E4BD353|nr:MerR family transcriptional regulator [Clostridium sp. AM58-1XD]RGY97368.1 MerR family transcriptional regulator [Clostridium sp. AM58-1XD]